MRRILLMAIILLVVILGFTAVFKGIQIGGLRISSVSQMDEQKKNLDSNIEQLNSLIDVQYPAKLTELKTASQNMQDAKDEYLEETNKSTNNQILEAMQQKSYRIEFLWVRLETHARQQSVVLKFEILPSSIGANNSNDIKFTVNGTYRNSIGFITAIENDTDLNFKIENFKMQPASGDASSAGGIILESTFNVRNVAIQEDTLSQITTGTEMSINTTDTGTNNASNNGANTSESASNNGANTSESTSNSGANTSESTSESGEEKKSAKDIMQEF